MSDEEWVGPFELRCLPGGFRLKTRNREARLRKENLLYSLSYCFLDSPFFTRICISNLH